MQLKHNPIMGKLTPMQGMTQKRCFFRALAEGPGWGGGAEDPHSAAPQVSLVLQQLLKASSTSPRGPCGSCACWLFQTSGVCLYPQSPMSPKGNVSVQKNWLCINQLLKEQGVVIINV